MEILLFVNGTERNVLAAGFEVNHCFLSMERRGMFLLDFVFVNGKEGISCGLAAKNFLEEGRKFCLGK